MLVFSPVTETEAPIPTYAGLKLWLDAAEGVTGTGWNDQSGQGNHASQSGSPTLVEEGLNGKPVMRYSGTNGEYHGFNNMTDIRTVFWVLSRTLNAYAFLLGDNNRYHFHTDGGNRFWHNNYAHNRVKNGVLRVNGVPTDGKAGNSFPPATPIVVSLRTTGNVEASSFSNDRNINGRYWNGDLGQLLIYNTALTDAQIEATEGALAWKYGLEGDLVGSHPWKNTDPGILEPRFAAESLVPESASGMTLSHQLIATASPTS